MKKLSFVLFAVLFCVPVLAINTDEIDAVRLRTQTSGSELSAADKAVIAKFWDTASNTMPLAETANEVVQIRRQLEDQKGSEPLSFYATAYIAVAEAKLKTAFSRIDTLSDPDRKELIERNLMILTARLESAKLIPLALQKIDDEDDVVRYWAVKAVTQQAIVSQLVSDLTRDEETVAEILKTLKTRVEFEKNAGILEMIIDFSMAIDTDVSRAVLMDIADQRIKSYMNWSVTHEYVDVKLLTTMSFLIVNQQNAAVQGQLAQKFAILYSMALQRYMLGKETLTDEQLAGVLTVIAEVDQSALDKNMEIKTRIIELIRRNSELDREYEALLGDRMRAGELGTKYKFDYGKDTSGKALTVPPKLGPPPTSPESTN